MPTTISGSTGVSQIQDGVVTNADIASMAASKLTGALPAISGASLTGITGTTTRIHAFSHDADGNLIWTHTEGNINLKDNNNDDNYLDVIIGSSDQVYSINSDGELICTFT